MFCVKLGMLIGLMCNSGSVYLCLHGMVSMILVLWNFAAIAGNGCEIQVQNYVAWLQVSDIPVGFHYRNLVLGI